MEAPTDLLSPSERDRVLQAVTALCAERGYEETTVDDVIERAGVSIGELEVMFADKVEMVVTAIDAVIGETVTAISSSYSADRSEWDSALLGIKAILEMMAAHPSGAKLSFVAARHMGPPQISETYRAGIKIIHAMLERLWEYSGSAVQPGTTARGALGGAEAVVRREIMAGRIEQLPRLLPDFVYGAMTPFLGQEEALRLSKRARELLRGSAWE